MATLAPPFSPEAQVVLLGARPRLSAEATRRLQGHLRRGVDEERVLDLARRHRVAPLLHRRLSAAPLVEGAPAGALSGALSGAPAGLLKGLQASFRESAVRGLHQTRALVRVLTHLEEHGISALPFKGAVLGERVYGNVALRPFGDLDILVSSADFSRARSLLLAQGFRPLKEMNAREEATYFQREKSYELVRGSILVELHWAFMHPMHGFRLDPDDVWERVQRTPLGDTLVPALAPEDLLLYLCVHGGKHFWERLSWICDVAECLHVFREDLSWPTLMERTRELNAERMLLLGLRLAADLLGAPCPAPVGRRARDDAAVGQLSACVQKRLFRERRDPDLTFDDIRFHLKMRERLRDKWPYYRQLGRLAVEPTEKDHAWVELQPGLHFAYYLVRPVRLLRDGLAGLVE